MRIPLMLIHVTYLTLAVMALGSITVRSEPEPMARPTRPKVFSSAEELRRYLDLVRDYYSLNGKARYGKRADPYSMQHTYEHPLNFLRMILAISRQKQQDQQGKYKQIDKEDRNKLQIIYPYDRVTRYYEIME